MAPPDEHFGPVEQCRIETLRRIVESRRAHKKALFFQRSGNCLAEKLFAVGLLLIFLPFVPDEHAHRIGVIRTRWDRSNRKHTDRKHKRESVFAGTNRSAHDGPGPALLLIKSDQHRLPLAA